MKNPIDVFKTIGEKKPICQFTFYPIDLAGYVANQIEGTIFSFYSPNICVAFLD
jgi:hypothetical protein